MGNKDEFNKILGMVLLPMVLVCLWILCLDWGFEENFLAIIRYVESKKDVLLVSILIVCAPYICVGFLLMESLGVGRFGGKIEGFKEKNSLMDFDKLLVGSFLLSVSVFWYFRSVFPLMTILRPFPSVIPSLQKDIISFVVDSSQVLGASLLLVGVIHCGRKLSKFLSGGVPKVPKRKNTLIVGTEIKDDAEKWISLGTKSLVTGLMTTASTGNGKSSACLLPWTKQILERFSPRPSVIVIDPKNSFARNVLDLSEELGLQDEVIHFTLDGKFRTNVIYQKNMLKDGGYSRCASMIQAATENYMGKMSGDGKFWGQKGYVFIKNMVMFCAGKYGDYFTLKDFYEEMTSLNDRDFGIEIEDILTQKNYDWEEKRNLRIAASYFNNEFTKLDNKFKDSLLVTSTSFLSLLRDARIEQVFCPPEDKVNFWGFDEIVDKGKIFVFGIDIPGIAGPMSVFMKLLYQRSVLNRIKEPERLKEKRLSFGIYDEYQSIVTVGGGQIEGDDDYAAKRREALGVTIVATQSLSSLMQSIGNETSFEVLVQNFRNQVIGHSKDKRTVEYCKYFAGEVEKVTESQSFSESGAKPFKNIFGGLHTEKPTVSQSINQNVQKVSRVNGESMSQLKLDEAVGFFFNGVDSYFVEKVGLKPSYLKKMRTSHEKVLKLARKAAMACLILVVVPKSFGYPTICSAVKSPSFMSCMAHLTTPCMCPGTPPRPCIRHSYFVPRTYIEVTTKPGMSFFSDMPGASLQLKSSMSKTTFGAEEMNSYFYNARVIQVPMSNLALKGMACGGSPSEKFCFDAVSEQIDSWKTGIADMKQPLFLAWKASVPMCLKKGMANAVTGDHHKGFNPGTPSCGFPLRGVNMFPPSSAENCTGWGMLMPRVGFVESSSTMGAALLAAKRIRSIAGEVYQTAPIGGEEKWSLVYPNFSGCFREGSSIGELETIRGANERGRLGGKNHQSFLFVVWRKVSCCKDYTTIPTTEATKAALPSICQGME